MKIDQIGNLLLSPDETGQWLRAVGFVKPDEAFATFQRLAESGLTVDLLSVVAVQIQEFSDSIDDLDTSLTNLELFVRSSRSPLALGGLFERDPDALPVLLQLFSISPFLSEILISDPGAYDLLRLTDGMPVSRESLIDELAEEVSFLSSSDATKEVLRRFQRREFLRIAFGDIVREQPVETVGDQLAYVADAIITAALAFATRDVAKRRGEVFGQDGLESGLLVMAGGELGGNEMSYASEVSLMMISAAWSSAENRAAATRRNVLEETVRLLIDLISAKTEHGVCYAVNILRPEGRDGSLVSNAHQAARHHEQFGRVWDRLAMVKFRYVAGNEKTAGEFLSRIEPWIYPRFLSRADISGIRAMRRSIQSSVSLLNLSNDRARERGPDEKAPKNEAVLLPVSDAICDIELTIQFLQLLHGVDERSVRSPNTLLAITQLEQASCLTTEESGTLRSGYSSCRRMLQRQQIASMEMSGKSLGPDSTNSAAKIQTRLVAVGQVLNHLLGDAFSSGGAIDSEAESIADLVLNPNPGSAQISDSLAPFGIRDARLGFQNLNSLSRERFRFLSTRRCRHFLAAIVNELLNEIAKTPDPDQTLQNLARVSDSLGGKGMLWELFSFSRVSLDLFVRFCSSSRYLSRILRSNPGMIDELIDALMVNQLADITNLRAELVGLTRSADSIDLILKSFKNSHHLRIGVRDLLGRDDVSQTHQSLSDIAEVCLEQIARKEFEAMVFKHGRPMIEAGKPCELIMLAMGKLGGQEPNYHSDLDVVFIYEGDGKTQHRDQSKSVSNSHFFSKLSSHISSMVNSPASGERLYELDSRLRPSGRSGPAVISLPDFVNHFRSDKAKAWERLALCKSRPILCSETLKDRIQIEITEVIRDHAWSEESAQQILDIRMEMEAGATETNLKRGVGGTLDIEFAMQLLQLKNCSDHPEVLVPGTLAAIEQLRLADVIDADESQFFSSSYRFLRQVESRLRLLMTDGRHELPEDQESLTQLAYLMNADSVSELLATCNGFRHGNRERFMRIASS